MVVSVETGSDVLEELAVTDLGNDVFLLLVPPALTMGLARGDEFTIVPETRRPDVRRHSANLTIWLYSEGRETVDTTALAAEVARLGGTFDGSPSDSRISIFTLPVAATFPRIETVFDHFAAEHPGSEWLYGNVYADDGVTPLGWWQQADPGSATS